MDRLFEKEIPLEELKLKVDGLLGEGKSGEDEWNFSKYGFTCHHKTELVFFTIVGHDGDGGCMSRSDLLKVIHYIQKQPPNYSILDKPPIMLHLESVTGLKAEMKQCLGRWYMQTSKISFFNNVFSLSLGYTDSVNNFEVYFPKTDDDPLEYVGIDELLEILHKGNYITHKCDNCGTYSKRLLRCRGKCGGMVRYCGQECQTLDWSRHMSCCKPPV
jgi:hypothetical protein